KTLAFRRRVPARFLPIWRVCRCTEERKLIELPICRFGARLRGHNPAWRRSLGEAFSCSARRLETWGTGGARRRQPEPCWRVASPVDCRRRGGARRTNGFERRFFPSALFLCNTVSVQFDFRAADQYYAVQVRRAASCLVSTTSS
ncbi:hypothetical protein ZEAMMB73_Zm00001d022260, partial [Zea mays]